MAPIFSLLIIALVVSVQAHSRPDFMKHLKNGTQKGDKVKGIGELKRHLARLGYIDPTMKSPDDDDDHIFDDTLHEALKEYQRFHKINVTGNLDTETVDSMLQPRCGLPDINRELTSHNSLFGDMKFELYDAYWPSNKRNLTVSLDTSGTDHADANGPVKIALDMWANVSPFRFNFIDDIQASDVKISFKSGDHGDPDRQKFDGQFGVAAHASPGPIDLTNVYLHFDNAENWWTQKENPKREKLDLQSVALHELGHILGLRHSQDTNSIMYPSINYGVRRGLNDDDIQGIKARYRN